MSLDLDALLDSAVVGAALSTGRDPRLAARQFGAAAVAAAVADETAARRGGNANRWSAADRAYLRRWSGVLGVDELAARLGRSRGAIEGQQTLGGLPTVTKHPEYITAGRMAEALGVDGHSIIRLIERGILPVEPAPLDQTAWRMRRTAFYAWATNPRNWVYFLRSVENPRRIRDEKLRRLIGRRAERWDDAWWSMGRVCAYHHAHQTVVGGYIFAGKLAAVRWGNWWVLRSEATRPGLRFHENGGVARFHLYGTPASDAFLTLAAAVGVPWTHIARMMGGRQVSSALASRHAAIVRRDLVPWLARRYGLSIRPVGGRWWADWRDAAHRFPLLARCWARLDEEGSRFDRLERGLLVGVLNAFLRAHRPGERMVGQGDARLAALREGKRMYEATLPREGRCNFGPEITTGGRELE